MAGECIERSQNPWCMRIENKSAAQELMEDDHGGEDPYKG
jgi:hypothetical protein